MTTPRPTSRLVLAVAALAGTVGLASCATGAALPTPANDVVTVTAYDQISAYDGASGPVTVTLTAAQAHRLVTLLHALGTAPTGRCMEDAALFVVTYRSGDHVRWTAKGDVCPRTVVVSSAHTSTARSDRSCGLMRFVDGLFPRSEAAGTRGYLFACGQ